MSVRKFSNFRGGAAPDEAEDGAATTGHAMVLVGRDHARGAFRLMNSFGRKWGDDGYAWIRYGL